jgi:glycerol-3-phosphate dehydrogenase
MDQLLTRYGTRAASLAAEIGDAGECALVALPEYSAEEVRWIVHSEWVTSLSDFTHRRTPLAFTGRLTPAVRDELSAVIGAELGWLARERTRQVEAAAWGLSD